MKANILSEIFTTVYNYVNSLSPAEIISTSLILAAIVFVIWKRLFHTKGPKILREGFFDDFAMCDSSNYI
jgi:hypothetical protein